MVPLKTILINIWSNIDVILKYINRDDSGCFNVAVDVLIQTTCPFTTKRPPTVS